MLEALKRRPALCVQGHDPAADYYLMKCQFLSCRSDASALEVIPDGLL
jgi:hypothetical protein